MSQIVVERSHRLPAKAARSLAETVARRLQHQYGGTFEWDGDRLTFSQTGASGHVALTRRRAAALTTPVRPSRRTDPWVSSG
jgi:putative polyhydroxyalkanoate system protein